MTIYTKQNIDLKWCWHGFNHCTHRQSDNNDRFFELLPTYSQRSVHKFNKFAKLCIKLSFPENSSEEMCFYPLGGFLLIEIDHLFGSSLKMLEEAPVPFILSKNTYILLPSSIFTSVRSDQELLPSLGRCYQVLTIQLWQFKSNYMAL